MNITLCRKVRVSDSSQLDVGKVSLTYEDADYNHSAHSFWILKTCGLC